jgi:hypothetical protein
MRLSFRNTEPSKSRAGGGDNCGDPSTRTRNRPDLADDLSGEERQAFKIPRRDPKRRISAELIDRPAVLISDRLALDVFLIIP